MTIAKKRVDFTEGPLFWRLIIFMLPIVATNLLQILYDVADKIVVGQFSGDPNALGAIGSTTFISGMIISFMIGVGGGAGVVVAQAFGAKNKVGLERSTHNTLILAAALSVAMTVIGYITAEPLLRLLDTPYVLFDTALLYLRIIYSGILGTAVYNAGASILRAVGDSASSLKIGLVSGALNVALNLLFVVVFKLSVAGVAIATVISTYFSAISVLFVLYRRRDEDYSIHLDKFIPHKETILLILRLGVPTGLQSACFSIANMATTAAVNSFGSTVYVSARSIATDIDQFSSMISGAFLPAALTATGQNVGARNGKRIKRVLLYTTLQAAVAVFACAMTILFFVDNIALLFIEASDPDLLPKVAAIKDWCGVMLSFHFVTGSLNALTGVVRGLGYSITPLILNIIGTVGTRLVWIYGVFFRVEELYTLKGLAYMYPISWSATTIFIVALLLLAIAKGKINYENQPQLQEDSRSADDPTPTKVAESRS